MTENKRSNEQYLSDLADKTEKEILKSASILAMEARMGMHVVMCWPDQASAEHPNAAPYVVGPFATGDEAHDWANWKHGEEGDLSAFVPMRLLPVS